MKVWGVSEPQLQGIAAALSVELHYVRKDGRALRFRIVPTGKRDERGNYRYQRTSASGFRPGRRVHAVCWHGHRDFMREVFRVNPEARIWTGWANYTSAENFEDTHGATAYRSVGSMMYPMFACDICTCDSSDTQVSHTRTIMQSDIAACPFVIMDMTHYRADGSCKCDDPVEQARMIREWGYSKSDFEDEETTDVWRKLPA